MPAVWDNVTIAQVIQIAVAPVFLLAGISALLGVMTNRLARVIDRSRILQRGMKQVSDTDSIRQIDREMAKLLKRGQLINYAIALATGSALSVCLVIMTLFLGGMVGGNFSTAIAVLFILCMGMLIIALVLFITEVFIATHSMRHGLIRTESLIMTFSRRDDHTG